MGPFFGDERGIARIERPATHHGAPLDDACDGPIQSFVKEADNSGENSRTWSWRRLASFRLLGASWIANLSLLTLPA